MWRSWLAHAPGGRGVAGSSPVTPTIVPSPAASGRFFTKKKEPLSATPKKTKRYYCLAQDVAQHFNLRDVLVLFHPGKLRKRHI